MNKKDSKTKIIRHNQILTMPSKNNNISGRNGASTTVFADFRGKCSYNPKCFIRADFMHSKTECRGIITNRPLLAEYIPSALLCSLELHITVDVVAALGYFCGKCYSLSDTGVMSHSLDCVKVNHSSSSANSHL